MFFVFIVKFSIGIQMDRQTIYEEFETNPIPRCPMWYNPQGKQKVQIVMHVLENSIEHACRQRTKYFTVIN